MRFIVDGPKSAPATVLLAHGAGAPMDSAWMTTAAHALSTTGLRVVRFEFDYMASRRIGSSKKPPPRAETLLSEYIAAIDALDVTSKLIIGGKSMGGRVASMTADALYASGRIAGLLCLSYPFHPVGKPDQLRTSHLVVMRTPTLIIQGTRDPLGSRKEAETYPLSDLIDILWLEDGDHDLKPRKSISGFTAADHMQAMSKGASAWIERITETR